MRVLIVAVPLLFLAGACTDDADPSLDLPQLMERLTTAGFTIDELGFRSPMPGFGSGEGLLLDGERVTAFEYSDEASAKASAARLSPDGSRVTNIDAVTGRSSGSAVDWVDDPHFYATAD